MKYDKCSATFNNKEQRENNGQTLCEDCYIDALSPLNPCDPWAVHNAKKFEQHAGGQKQITSIQEKIIHILETEGTMEPDSLDQKIGESIDFQDLQREFITLRHMEKVRSEKQGDKILWRFL